MPPPRNPRSGSSAPGGRIVAVVREGETRRAVEGLAAAVGAPVSCLPSLDVAPVGIGADDLVVVELDLLEGSASRVSGLPVVIVGARAASAEEWSAAVDLGAEAVLRLPEDEERLSRRLSAVLERSGRRATVLGFVGGRGGAGASVLAVAVARCAARRGLETLLVDGDPLGGGLDLMLGAEEVTGVRWPGLLGARGLLPASTVPLGLPRVDGVWVLSGDRVPALPFEEPPLVPVTALTSVLEAARRRVDVVIVDLPRWALWQTGGLGCDRVHLVTPADVNSVAASTRVSAALAALSVPACVVVRGPAPGGLRAESIAEVLGLPLAGFLRAEQGLAGGLERREPPGLRARGPLSTLADRLLDGRPGDLPRAPGRGDAGDETRDEGLVRGGVLA